MQVEIIGGVKTIWHSDKDETLQKMANLLLKFLYENEVKRQNEMHQKLQQEQESK